ncbi:MAG: carboxypeptidase regulatory-like domain-containing protein, partial [Actinomycetia bacterium]|nr:carboxypeptidase regulatory-like domain-containing protein [Actinomycetes bacterium]
AHDTAADAKQLVDGATTPITFTVTNDGTEPLVNVVIKDTPASGSSALTGLSCLVPGSTTPIAANATTGEVTWAGPFAVNAVITCTGTLPAVALGATHADTASVTGAGEYTGTSVSDQNEWHGFVPSFAVGDYVWQDDNGNGIQNTGEPPVTGVTVTLLDGTGATVATTTTDAAGYYLFDMLPAGDYQVKFTLPSGDTWTTSLAGTDRAVDSNADTNGLSALFTLDVGQTGLVASTDPSLPTDYTAAAQWVNPTVDAGIIPPAHVDIQKYDTLNGDTKVTGDHDTAADPKVLTQDTTTPITFTITNDGLEPLVDITVKDTPALGSVALTGLSCTFPDATTGVTWAGPFAVGASFTCTGTLPGVPLDGTHADTASVIGTGEFSGSPVDSTDEWHAVVPSYAVGDYVWIDLNGNGIQDANEPIVPGVTVKLLDGTGAVVATTTTDASGYFLFDDLPAGTYQLQFTLPAGYDWTKPVQGTDQKVDSDADSAGLTAQFTLGDGAPNLVPSTDPTVPPDYTVKAGAVNPTIDAGIIPVPVIAIEKYDTLAGDTRVTGAHDTSADAKTLVADTTTPITMLITNTGTEPLLNITVTDTPATGSAALTGLTCTFPDATTGVTWAGPFAAGASFTCTGRLPGMAANTAHTDTASVVGTGQYTGTTVNAANEWHAIVPAQVVTHPALTIVKTAYPADPSTQPCPWPVATGGTPKVTDPACQPPSTDATGPVPQLKVGATAYYDFLVTNTGDVTLTNVTVSETDFSGLGTMSAITCPQTTLDPGQFMHCSATYVVQQGDLPPGKVINVAQSTGKEPGGSLVTSNTSTAKITVVAPPAGPLGGVAGATGYAMAAGWIMMALGLAIGLYYMGSVATRRREEATR